MESPQGVIGEIKPSQPKSTSGSHNQPETITGKAPLDAVVVAGMGPLRLKELTGSDRLFPLNPYNRHNAIAAKLLASNGIVNTVIASGTATGKSEGLEQIVSEGELLADTYDRAGGKGIDDAGRIRAEKIIEVDSAAKTTFDNVIQAINALDERSGGYWQGSFAVLSSEFHVPRIKEILRAFGLNNARVLSAQRVLRHFGYSGRLYPKGDFGYGKSYEEFEDDIYQSQPAGLENLQDNPSYVTFELSKIKSNRRLWEIANSIRTYYSEREITLPDAYSDIPMQYDEGFDYNSLRARFSLVVFSKHEYSGTELSQGKARYRDLAASIGQETEDFLQSVSTPKS